MHRVETLSHYGQPIELEQCRECGGIWFDESELFRAKQGESKKVESLNISALRNRSPIKNVPRTCPRDQSILHQFTDKLFPKDIVLMRCPHCSGIWLNRGVFTRYQEFRHDLKGIKLSRPYNKKFEESVSQLLVSHQSGRSTETLKRLGISLNTPVDETSVFLGQNLGSQNQAANTALNALGVLTTLLRLFILKF